MTPLCLL